MQKGIDLIADVFFSVLAENPSVQLICVGPVIDLYGKFAALKLEKMMQKYPGRVFSKPHFTVLPPCIFSGAEFALIPSRDEPFGLVAVEFGRKGALGVGARVGGLGQMPGWWFTIESTTTIHLTKQFKSAIRGALASKQDTRAIMRARSLIQRFPVAQWIEDLEKLQSTSINISQKEAQNALSRGVLRYLGDVSGLTTPNTSAPNTRPSSRRNSFSRNNSPFPSQPPTPSALRSMSPAPDRPMTPSQNLGPGHKHQTSDEDANKQNRRQSRSRKRLTKTPPMSRATSVGSMMELDRRNQGAGPGHRPRTSDGSETDVKERRQSRSRRRLTKTPPLSRATSFGSLTDLERRVQDSQRESSQRESWDPRELLRSYEDAPLHGHHHKRSSSASSTHQRRKRRSSIASNDLQRNFSNSQQFPHRGRQRSYSGGHPLDSPPPPIPNLPDNGAVEMYSPKRISPTYENSNAERETAKRISGGAAEKLERRVPKRSLTGNYSTSSNVTMKMFPPPQTPGTYSPGLLSRNNSFFAPPFAPKSSVPASPTAEDSLLEPPSLKKRLSVNSIINSGDSKKEFNLQKVDPFFTDSNSVYYDAFSKKLDSVDAKNSETTLCIEDYLVKSEKRWFSDFHRAKLGMSSANSSSSSVFRLPWTDREEPNFSPAGSRRASFDNELNEFNLSSDYVAPNGLKKFLQKKIGDWQIYCFLLAFGQIIAANSYQITLLTGEYGRADQKLYAIAAIYFLSSWIWWYGFRRIQAFYVLSIPFAIYALAFFVLGLGLFTSGMGTDWVYNVASGLYAMASASGSLYFALNFGTEGGTPTQAWAFRACVIQGCQQLYVAFLWYWGSVSTESGNPKGLITSPAALAGVCWPIAVLMAAIAAVLYLGLPNYYRQKPGKVPSFYTSLFRRKIVVWFFVMVIIQNYFLSAPYNRNWRYLWSSQHASGWSIFLLLLVFFVGVWGLGLYLLAMLSKKHSWVIPIFAVGLGAPRWAQMLWGTSNLGFYVPWGSLATGALLGRTLWLWLGVLDALQGVGFGMILLQTLTRFHIAFVLIAAQAVGSLTTILARATAPNRIGPGDVFPDFAIDYGAGLAKGWFWTALLLQIVICVGFLAFFRKEQLFKP